MTIEPRIAAAAALALSAAACCDNVLCDLCGPALSVTVTDAATGEPIASATASRGDCNALGRCDMPGGAGRHAVELTAPGYERQKLEITVPEGDGGCCDCGYQAQHAEVALVFIGCAPGESAACRCPHEGDPADDGQIGSQTCNDAGDGWLPCATPTGACR